MNEKIPLRALAEEISRRSGCDIDVAQSYIKALFAIVADRLLNGETVTINGLGTFAPIPNPDEPLRFAVILQANSMHLSLCLRPSISPEKSISTSLTE